jgi:uncharacterized protein (UPF0332 family)
MTPEQGDLLTQARESLAAANTFHRYLIRGMQVRHAGDYGTSRSVSREEAAEQITHAEQFLELAARLIDPPPSTDTEQT